MDETTNVAAEIDTQPEVDTQGAENNAEVVDFDETPAPPEQPIPEVGADGEIDESAPPVEEQLLTVKFNKQLRALSREDATNYAQKGMKYDAISPMLDTLKYVAASEGKTLAELVEAIRKQNEDNVYSRIMERCGDEEIAKELLEVEKGKHKAAYESLLEREKNEENETDEAVTQRLADEFADLKKEFPQFTEFKKVPQSVVKESVQKGVSLLDAYLRYEHRERVRSDNAKTSQAAAAKASTGSQQSDGTATMSPVEAAMMKGLWG